MQSHRRYAVAALLLVSSCGFAAAAEVRAPFRASDDFVLTGAQESLIWHSVGRQRTNRANAPSAFEPSIYAAVPSSIVLRTLPAAVTGQVPMVRPYKYVTLGDALLIINPADRKIVDIIRP
jgi:Protein of unknown function (DUF1236)